MKLTRKKKSNEYSVTKPKHLRNLSQELSNPESQTNYFISKAISIMPKIKNEYYLNGNITNLKNCIQNRFDSEGKKGNTFQNLINKNRDLTANPSPDFERALNASISPEIKISESYNVLCPYQSKKYNIKNRINISKSKSGIRTIIKPKDNISNIYNNSDSMKFISDDEPLNQKDIYKENNFWQCNNNILSNLIKVKNNNKNKGNKHSYISMISSTYNSPYNTGSIIKKKIKKKENKLQPNDYLANYSLENNLSCNERHITLNNNPYTNYMNFSNIDNIKKKILKTDTDYLINISGYESMTDRNILNENKKIKNNFYINNKFFTNNNKYIKRIHTDRDNTFDENTDIRFIKKNIYKKEFNNNNNNKNCYVHKSLKHKKIQKKYLKVNLSTNNNNFKSLNVVPKENIVGRNDSDEKVKSNINIYGRKNIKVNTLKNKNKPQNISKISNQEKKYKKNELSKVNVAQINIKKTFKNKFNANPPSILFSLKNYEKSPREINNDQINKIYYNNNNNNNNGQKNINSNKKNGIKIKIKNNLNNNKFIFNNEEEILYYIKKKYNNKQINKLFYGQENHTEMNRSSIEKQNKYFSSLTSDEGNRIVKKNEELFEQIKQLIDENKQYKKELNDIKTKFDDLSKEVLTLKEKKY